MTKQYIPYERITEGEALLLLSARNLELRAENATGAEAPELLRRAQHLRTVQARGLHRVAVQSLSYQGLDEFLINAVNRTSPAMRPSLQGLVFDPTDAQIQACREEVENRLNSEGIFQDEARERLTAQYLQECFERSTMTNIVNAHLENAGTALLYAAMPQTTEFNGVIANKNYEQKAWIAEVAKTTGLSRELVALEVQNGILAQTGKPIEQIHSDLKEFIRKGGNPNGNTQNLTGAEIILAIELIGKIVAIISRVVASAKLLITLIQQRKQNTFLSIKDPSVFAAAKEDFNDNGIPDNEETLLQSLLTPANMLLAGGIVVALDPFKWFGEKNTKYVIGAALAGIGIYMKNNTTKRWIVNGKSLTADELKAANYIEYQGGWYPAELLEQQTGLGKASIEDIIKTGIDVADKIADAIKKLKVLFAGQNAATTSARIPIWI